MPAPTYCSVCHTASLSPISVKRGITRCRSCAAKARGLSTEHQRRAGQARGAQLKRAWDAAKASGLI
jgi:ribosomal protein L37AE/L43A